MLLFYTINIQGDFKPCSFNTTLVTVLYVYINTFSSMYFCFNTTLVTVLCKSNYQLLRNLHRFNTTLVTVLYTYWIRCIINYTVSIQPLLLFYCSSQCIYKNICKVSIQPLLLFYFCPREDPPSITGVSIQPLLLFYFLSARLHHLNQVRFNTTLVTVL